MTDRKTLDLLREEAEIWAGDIARLGTEGTMPHIAAELILSLPDTIVDGDKLREVVADHHIDMSEELMEALGALLPDPPAPPTMAEIEWADEEHHLAEATAAWTEGYASTVVMLNKSGKKITVYRPDYQGVRELNPGILTPTGRRYRLQPEDDTPASPIEDKPAPEPASPRPEWCCGACPETVGGGVDCTCADNPRCPNHQPRPEDVPVGEPWQVEVDGNTAIGYRNDPEVNNPWQIIPRHIVDLGSIFCDDEAVTLIARLVPETTEQNDEAALDPDYIYRDRDGDEWEHIDGAWISGKTHEDRVARRESNPGRPSMPEWFGPYTRIEEEEATPVSRLVPEQGDVS